jgi:hypothetical protein
VTVTADGMCPVTAAAASGASPRAGDKVALVTSEKFIVNRSCVTDLLGPRISRLGVAGRIGPPPIIVSSCTVLTEGPDVLTKEPDS